MTSGLISPGRHGMIDYGFAVASLAAPTLIGLTGTARAVPAALGAGVGVLAALTDQPYAVRRDVSLSTHGRIEAVAIPACFVALASRGAVRQPRARLFFALYFAAALITFFLTDYDQ